jgi:hypothetical protein
VAAWGGFQIDLHLDDAKQPAQLDNQLIANSRISSSRRRTERRVRIDF